MCVYNETYYEIVSTCCFNQVCIYSCENTYRLNGSAYVMHKLRIKTYNLCRY